ncbi:hypothetical protein D3C87_2149880 [compost metagenome]
MPFSFSRKISAFQIDWRTGSTKSIFVAPNSACSGPEAHCRKYQVASLSLEKLDMASDQIQMFGVEAVASGFAAKAA